MPQRPALITTPYPTLDETAKLYGISKKRQKEILQMVEEILTRLHDKPPKRKAGKNATEKSRRAVPGKSVKR